MQTILTGLSNLATLSLLFPLIYAAISWKELTFRDWKEVFKSALFPAIRSLTDFGETIISVFIIGIIMQQVIAKPSASAHSYDLLIQGFMNWLNYLFLILWSKDSTQLVKEISENKESNEYESNNKKTITFLIFMCVFGLIAMAMLHVFKLY